MLHLQLDRALLLASVLVGSGLEAGGIEVSVSPRVVYRRSSCRLEAKVGAGEEGGEAIRWEAGGGRLSGEKGARVFWQAPPAAGPVRVRAKLLRGDAVLDGEITIEVREPSRAGMVRVPAGVFTMGDSWTDVTEPRYIPTSENKHDRPAHPVYLDEYLIDRCEVTNRQYVSYLEAALAEGLLRVEDRYVLGEHEGSPVPFYRFSMEEAPLLPKKRPTLEGAISWDGSRFQIRKGSEEHPVVDVTWTGAAAFAAYYGKRLPTEAEWEKAARGTDGRRHPWGNELPTPYHANVNKYYPGLTPVGKFSPRGDSPYGACDMLGNAHEWVQDWFNDDIFADVASDVPVRNPTGPEWGGMDHTVRGLAWNDGAMATPRERSPLSWRYSWSFEFSYGDGYADGRTGFRAALSP
jgi:formylglycine-generating enzyme required for sulfatase activity